MGASSSVGSWMRDERLAPMDAPTAMTISVEKMPAAAWLRAMARDRQPA